MSELTAVDEKLMLQQQSVLAKFGELALRSNDPDEVLTEACRLVGEGLGTDLAKVMELQEDGRTLLVRAGVGWNPGVVGEVTLQAVEGSSEGYALATGEPMISPDIATETRFHYPQFLIDNGVRAVANVVIIGGQGRPPFGILQVDSRTPRLFTDRDTAFLRSYANLLAAAVDRMRVIDEVREGQERLRLALEAGELGSWEVDLASGAVTSTPRTMRIFGYADTPPDWTYDTLISRIVPEEREQVAGALRAAVETGVKWSFECRILRADDGEVRWIEAQGRACGSRGNTPPTHLVGIVADTTMRKQAEETLRQSHDALEARVAARTHELVAAHDKLQVAAEERERVEEALRQSNKMEAVGQLTGGLAHDFNNLITGISGSLEMIRTRVTQGRTSELRRYIESALASSNRAAALTQRLLAFSRRQTLDPKPTDMNLLVGGMEDLFRRTVGPAVRIETRLVEGLRPSLCDPNQLESALLNLVINARDAMPDGGHLLIETADIMSPDPRGTPSDMLPDTLAPGGYVALSVIDTGTGMSPAVLARAFDPFFTTKPFGQGTGLGLSITYGFAKQSGGHVHLQSHEGQGTRATIYLPRYLGVMNGKAEGKTEFSLPEAPANAVVLVVEDEPPVRMIVVDVLLDRGYTVLEAGDGRSGLHIVESSTRIDLLVTDVGLPGGMNGRQLAQAAREKRPELKVLFMTGYAEGSGVGKSLLDHGMQVMMKPFGVEALVARVHGIMTA